MGFRLLFFNLHGHYNHKFLGYRKEGESFITRFFSFLSSSQHDSPFQSSSKFSFPDFLAFVFVFSKNAYQKGFLSYLKRREAIHSAMKP